MEVHDIFQVSSLSVVEGAVEFDPVAVDEVLE